MDNNIDLALGIFDKNETVLVQNLIPIKDPGFTKKPTWYMNGNEKCVKIGNQSFNYIDYLEAHHNIDCDTHRSEWVLMSLDKKIVAAMEAIGYKD